jgi:NAD(P)-dependent dehydrogenase (short-subunit alcohol dehydrogenase family)
MVMTVWFITGASRGFGLEIAREALSRGDQVVATARDPRVITSALGAAGESLLAVELDVHRPDHVGAAVDAAVSTFGRIDALVNNAGRGLVGAVEEVSDQEARAAFDVNVFGLLDVTRAVLPHMRAQRSGLVVNFSSVGGFVAWPGWGVYCATKFAVEAISEALGHELAPLGIKVTAIEPGPFRTDFLEGSSLHVAADQIDDYAASGGVARTWAADANQGQEGDPRKAAKIIVDLAAADRLPQRIQLGARAIQDVAAKIELAAREHEQWRDIGLSADFDAAVHP